MSSKSQARSLFSGLILLALVVAGLYVVNRMVSGNQGGAPLTVTPEGIGSATLEETDTSFDDTQTETFPPILVGSMAGSDHQLVKRPSEGASTLLFTDKDETYKIQRYLGTNFNDLVFAWVTKDGVAAGGYLASVTTDGAGQIEVHGGEIGTSSPPALSPNGQRVAFISFDNTEGNFGFALKSATIVGEDELAIDQDPQGVSLPAWSPTGALAYVVGQATPESGQKLKVRTGSQSTTIFTGSSDQTISDLVWVGTKRLALVVEPVGNNTRNKAKVMIIDASTGQTIQTIDQPGKERSLRASQSGSLLAMITGEVQGLGEEVGDVVLIDLETQKEESRGQATSLAGFLQ